MKKMTPTKTREGKPCREGHTIRYTSNGTCVECTRVYSKKYRQENREKHKEYSRKYRDVQENREYANSVARIRKATPEFKKDRREKDKKRRQEDPIHRTKKNLSTAVYNFYKLRGSEKEGRTHELLGYTAKECNDYIESLFQEGMTWKNRSEWNIDHINPQSNFKSIDQLKECYALSNLKPEWKEWNNWKNNRFIGSSEEYPMPKKVIKN